MVVFTLTYRGSTCPRAILCACLRGCVKGACGLALKRKSRGASQASPRRAPETAWAGEGLSVGAKFQVMRAEIASQARRYFGAFACQRVNASIRRRIRTSCYTLAHSRAEWLHTLAMYTRVLSTRALSTHAVSTRTLASRTLSACMLSARERAAREHAAFERTACEHAAFERAACERAHRTLLRRLQSRVELFAWWLKSATP